jgi:phospholipid/cholesterol/gamma-HCH transport system substrate-binding protein
MENKSHAIAAGTFVLVVLALLVTLAVWLTRETGLQQVYEISTAEAVTGLQPQASVRFKGVNVGKVTFIGFDPLNSGHVLIRIAIDEQAPITESSFATLGFQGVTGLAFVQLDDKGESKTSLAANEDPPKRIPMRPGLIAKLSSQGERILSEVEETGRRINLLLNAENQKSLMTAIGSVAQAATGISQFSTQAGKVLPQLAQDTSATLKIIQATSQRVGDSADEARASARAFRAVTERMNEPGGTLEQLSQAGTTLADTSQSLNASTLPRLKEAANDMARAARSVNRAFNSVNDNPQSLLLGNAPAAPGPGEPGFSAELAKP